MKPVAYRYKLSTKKKWTNVAFTESSFVQERLENPAFKYEPLYAIDFTKYKLVPLDESKEMDMREWIFLEE